MCFEDGWRLSRFAVEELCVWRKKIFFCCVWDATLNGGLRLSGVAEKLLEARRISENSKMEWMVESTRQRQKFTVDSQRGQIEDKFHARCIVWLLKVFWFCLSSSMPLIMPSTTNFLLAFIPSPKVAAWLTARQMTSSELAHRMIFHPSLPATATAPPQPDRIEWWTATVFLHQPHSLNCHEVMKSWAPEVRCSFQRCASKDANRKQDFCQLTSIPRWRETTVPRRIHCLGGLKSLPRKYIKLWLVYNYSLVISLQEFGL